MTVHTTVAGIEQDDDWFAVTCDCGWHSGAMPDPETLIDAAMEHAYRVGVEEGRDTL